MLASSDRQDQVVRGLVEVLRLPAHLEAVARRQVDFFDDATEIARRLVERVAGGNVGVVVDRVLPVRAGDTCGPEASLQPRDVVDPDRLARGRGDRQLADHVDVAALALQHANRHGVLLAGFAIRRDLVVAGHHQPERVADRRHAHPEVGGARPIHSHLHFGAGIAVVGFRVDETRRRLGLLDDPL